MLAEREVASSSELPAELARERQLNHARYDGIQAQLARLSPEKDGAEIERLHGQLRALRAESADITARARAASPRWAALHAPEPLDARAAGLALDRGTALAAFAVGEEKTLLFVLAIPETAREGEDNGLLQVWEIFDTLRLDAELVTLSGCETALGEEMGGEGLMSLTRAFHYAGARSVLASLWRVPDQSTSDLMVRFYGHLKEGRSKAEALRLAQLELIRLGGRAAHPFRWAAFSVFGDWR